MTLRGTSSLERWIGLDSFEESGNFDDYEGEVLRVGSSEKCAK